MTALHLFEEPVARGGADAQFQMICQAQATGDLHVLEHVLDGEMRLKIAFEHFLQFHLKRSRIAGISLHRGNEFFER